jgi:hypothetical protein
VLKRIFGLKREEMIGGWRKLQNEEVHNLYSLPCIIRMTKSRRIKWACHIVHMGKRRNACRIVVGKPEGKRSMGRPRCRWEDEIKTDLRQTGLD